MGNILIINKLIRFLLVPILSILIFSGYKPANVSTCYQTSELMVSLSLDSIPPGSISQKQAGSLKELGITSGGVAYHAKSFDFSIIPKGGPSHFIKCIGNKIPSSTLIYLRNAKPGDLIIVGNLMLSSNIKYKPVLDPMWTVVADAK